MTLLLLPLLYGYFCETILLTPYNMVDMQSIHNNKIWWIHSS